MMFEGVRVQVHKIGKDVRLYTRGGYDNAHRLPSFSGALAQIAAHSAVIDGEFIGEVAPREQPKVSTLYEREVNLCLWAFDLLALNGRDLRSLPLIARKKRLSRLIIDSGVDCIEFAESFNDPVRLLASCDQRGLGGTISKRLDAPYRSGRRSDWVRVRCTSWREESRISGNSRELRSSRGLDPVAAVHGKRHTAKASRQPGKKMQALDET